MTLLLLAGCYSRTFIAHQSSAWSPPITFNSAAGAWQIATSTGPHHSICVEAQGPVQGLGILPSCTFGTLADARSQRFFAVGGAEYNGPNASDAIVGVADRTVTRVEFQLNDSSKLPASIINGVVMATYASEKRIVGVSLITKGGPITCPAPADPKGHLLGFRC